MRHFCGEQRSEGSARSPSFPCSNRRVSEGGGAGWGITRGDVCDARVFTTELIKNTRVFLVSAASKHLLWLCNVFVLRTWRRYQRDFECLLGGHEEPGVCAQRLNEEQRPSRLRPSAPLMSALQCLLLLVLEQHSHLLHDVVPVLLGSTPPLQVRTSSPASGVVMATTAQNDCDLRPP